MFTPRSQTRSSRLVSLSTLALAMAACQPSATQRQPRPRQAGTDSIVRVPLPDEATACRATEDCVRVAKPAESELAGGFCCDVCAGYLARNRAWQARQPTCDSRTRGACPVSCAQGAPPPVACEAGRCVLTYPPASTSCERDQDCVVLPQLDLRAPETSCRIACGRYVVGNRDWEAWRGSLWQNESVTGQCPATCVDQPLPSAQCVSGQCAVRPARAVRTVRVDLRAPHVSGPLSAELITGVVSAAGGRLAECRQRARSLAPIGYAGFTVHFTVGLDGRATAIDAGELSQHLPDIAACMVDVLRGLTFQSASAAVTTVEFPMGAAFEPL